MPINISQHLNMLIQLIPNLYTQLPLPSNRLPEPIQSLILLSNNLGVIGMNLLIVEMRLIGWTGGRIIPVREESVSGVLLLLN
jgi:hypothetical protein